ncbi:MAG: 2-oxoglutarate oxidoreductase [Candidatus Aureabacteria bacterium]|nr:2-oxoglutarate oxidoreductase [Candidatus Auribacterota bacterium]
MQTETKKQYLFKRPESLRDVITHYCPGCGHGLAHRLVAEVIDKLGVREKTICVVPVGCACIAYDYFNFDCTEAPHGRTPAVATGLKRALPDKIVFTYQGDGDLAAIGTSEILHAANRGEHITVIFINNAVYGMTGGQMAPTTLLGQKTATTPKGREPISAGYPLKITEILSSLDGVSYAVRGLLTQPKEIRLARQYILKAFEKQLERRGFSIVELLSSCPTYWRMNPRESKEWIETIMVKQFPPGVLKDK